jgi:hypothetical protein
VLLAACDDFSSDGKDRERKVEKRGGWRMLILKSENRMISIDLCLNPKFKLTPNGSIFKSLLSDFGNGLELRIACCEKEISTESKLNL